MSDDQTPKPLTAAIAALVDGEATPKHAVAILRALWEQGLALHRLAVVTPDERGNAQLYTPADGEMLAWVAHNRCTIHTPRGGEVDIHPATPPDTLRRLIVALALAQGYTVVEP